MAKRLPRLLFTEEELETPELQKPIKKAEKAQKKRTKAESKIPKRRSFRNSASMTRKKIRS